jgi:NADPH-dependent glutamate synthase beta subunit-like oxidoreductase/ferredoxin
MPRITIDGCEVQVPAGATILDAAEKVGISIPTMCYMRGHEATTSCMVCVVKVAGVNGLVPACGALVQDGTQVQNDCPEVLDARKAAIELLLSDHVGDCLGPCQMGCPAHMNIPQMIRQIAAGQWKDAIATVKRDIALPAVLGRICPAPCEKACRRRQHDEAVSICLLKRYVADVDLQSQSPYMPAISPRQSKRVAIVGAGPAGLAAAYYLQQGGFDCTVFDDHDEPGGMLRYGVPEENLPRDVLKMEIERIGKLGVAFQFGTRVGVAVSMDELRGRFHAVLLAAGELKPDDAASLGVELSAEGVMADSRTGMTSVLGVFAGGDVVRKRRLAVRAVADGKAAAESIRRYLTGERAIEIERTFNSRMGKLQEGEMEVFLRSASAETRRTPSSYTGGFNEEQARAEARRCLHCDCRKQDACLLRQHAAAYGARQARYRADRRRFVQRTEHPKIIYEPGKCISCGICIQIASASREKLGLTFIGRGFDVRVAVPFDASLAEGLQIAAAQCVQACPTGALAFKEHQEP